ncbi:MAG: hypothetical protein FWH34_03025 [Desulfovibrionaceae bacterium]|nr:hypothetical protein [Desulfovibrionaceae bacterium]
MARYISMIKEIDVAAVEGNKTLAAGVDRRALKRCKEAIEELGVLHTPVVGRAEGGRHMLLSGQCELSALRALGVKKMDAAIVSVSDGGGSAAKLALLLMSLREKPGALCEGLLLKEAVNSGVLRPELQSMLGRSASWVSNRLSLVTRLDDGVYQMVRSGLLDPRSAQEVARLPAEAQFRFAEAAVREGLPKSAIEPLVAGFNDKGCPDSVKAQILEDPRSALKRMADKRRAVNAGGLENAPLGNALWHIKAAGQCIAAFRQMLSSRPPDGADSHKDALTELEADLSALLAMVRRLVSPGKTEVCHGG